jgi:hypothetical protein
MKTIPWWIIVSGMLAGAPLVTWFYIMLTGGFHR